LKNQDNSLEGSQIRLKRPALRDAVLSKFKESIINGEFNDGEKITEAEMAKRLGVSRGLVREMLRELENTGIVVNIPYRGTFIRTFTAQRVHELYTLRSCLEEFAIEIASKRAKEAEINVLENLLGLMHTQAQNGDVVALVETDLEFHKKIASISSHNLLIESLERLSGQTHMFILATKAIYTLFPTLEDVANSHSALIRSIRLKDSSMARDEIHKHICDVGDRLVEILLEQERIQGEIPVSEMISIPQNPLF
jgi:DNA-binding GntR family transcriptional regulator